jgi:hypothetical protein
VRNLKKFLNISEILRLEVSSMQKLRGILRLKILSAARLTGNCGLA